MSSGFIIGQDVETLHSRESNQLRNSNDREYMEEKAEQYVQSTTVYQKISETQEIFPANQALLVSPGSSWTMTLVSNPHHLVSTDVLFRVRWVTICVRECGVARGG